MQINKTNNVIFLREFESNLISEAFVILKEDVKFSNVMNLKNKNTIGKINVLKEAEFLINQKINENKLEYEKLKNKKLKQKIKILKIVNTINIIVLISIVIINY